MGFERYEYNKHEPKVRGWLEARGLAMPPDRWLPSFGVVADDVACGFLMTMAPGLNQIECIAADPKASKEVRAKALKRLIEMLETITRESGADGVRVLAALPAMKERFKELGYVAHGDFTLFAKSWR